MNKKKQIKKAENNESKVISKIFNEHATMTSISSAGFNKDNFENILSTHNESIELTKSLGDKNTLQAMLATQMASTHELQKTYFGLAKMSMTNYGVKEQQHYINTFAKLTNIFIQQATLMNKLQGNGAQQKVVVEHIHINNGGQAVVGNVSTSKCDK